MNYKKVSLLIISLVTSLVYLFPISTIILAEEMQKDEDIIDTSRPQVSPKEEAIVKSGVNTFSLGAISRTQTDAVNWAKSAVGKKIDYDGAYGAQCVDLTKA